MAFAGLVGLCISLGITLLSPIGSKLGDIFGRKAVVVVAGLINLVCGVGIAFAVILLKHEASIEQPIIPIKLFKEKQYLMFLLVGAICYFGRGAVDNYAPPGAQEVIKTSVALSGSLQLPKTLLTMILPAICGAWMAKKKTRMWKAMLIATALFAIPLLAMGFTVQAGWYIIVYFVVITISGIAESFRGISFTPAAQSRLKPEDMGIGTSMINFANSLVASVAAAVYSAIYGICTASGVTADTVQNGVNGVFLTAGLVTVVGVALVLVVVRPMLEKEAKAEAAE